jgi:hypothetical protein
VKVFLVNQFFKLGMILCHELIVHFVGTLFKFNALLFIKVF